MTKSQKAKQKSVMQKIAAGDTKDRTKKEWRLGKTNSKKTFLQRISVLFRKV